MPPRSSVLGLALLLLGCAGFPWGPDAPEVHLTGISPLGGGLLAQTLRLEFRLENPNNHDLQIDGLECEIEVNQRPFARGRSNQALTLPRLGSATYSVEATTTVLDVLGQISGLGGLQGLGYVIRGRIYLPGTSRTLRFERTAAAGGGGS